MTIVVLVLLVVMWVVVLGPSLVRSRMQRHAGDSIGAFQRQLGVIQRAGPAQPGPGGDTEGVQLGSRRPAARPTAGTGPDRSAPAALASGARPAALASGARPAALASGARQRTLRRRRVVLGGLMAGLATTLVLGFLPPLRVLWGLSAVTAVLLVAYVALLINLRNRAAEREMKLSFLPRRSEPALLMRRSATN